MKEIVIINKDESKFMKKVLYFYVKYFIAEPDSELVIRYGRIVE